jgi:antitoxin component HigA of HigAB toxin-antitoxin module
MKTARKPQLKFAALPCDYAALCRLHLPRPIHDKAEYENTLEMAAVFAGFEIAMNADQTDYFNLLCSLLKDWESAHVKWKKLPAVKIIQHLLDEQSLSGADLSRILGVTRNLGPMLLRGEREITAAHARTLGAHFGLPAGLFIE